MYQEERLLEIIEYLKIHERISVNEMMDEFNISRDTARRDLVKLEEKNAIVRTRGGAILPKKKEEIKSYSDRLQFDSDVKTKIAKRAQSLIQRRDTLLFDTSTTVQYLAEILTEKDAVVLTNSIHQAQILSQKPNVEIHLLGGILNKEHGFLYGSSLIERLNHYYVDKVFIGAAGLSVKGFTYPHEEDAMVKKEMTRHGEQVIVLVDHTKFRKKQLYRSVTFQDVDIIITDRTPDSDIVSLLQEYNVELIIVE
ncbi:DeoR/GlpR family DNA-binding transcription regulator [Alkalihalobacillus sp. AL-G]|uniref:DeoR/GlpR family DNA-binding transcription regulator n=1 Tax=Alkalihalobacillus sp. AL-G TaxID=2926399 RepID=UPI002729A025|nr:DeoR/GlpR family DNA-binding transcription regulator [Alkalihalobacillus sp. AL-G]WLD91578.1 DeoR/GlpR family DNA-binding transcription regulator [Alkalihalobacillus sp. AL-G]